MALFQVFTGYIALLAVVGVLVAYMYYRDTLHPLLVLLAAASYIYVYIPIDLYASGALTRYLEFEELSMVQGLNAACLTALFLGCIAGSRGIRRDEGKRDVHSLQMTPEWRRRLYVLSLILGGLGLLLYFYGLSNVGGFISAYSRPKGGGYAASGYLRDFTILTLPAVILLFMSRLRRSWRTQDTALTVLFVLPQLGHGLLSARRGPTFMGIATLVVGWYLIRYERPALLTILGGGIVTAVLLLVLVNFRGEIYIGSDFFSQPPGVENVIDQSIESGTEGGYGNTFIYGSQAVILARDYEYQYWGKRYLTYVFVRPIPSSIWPDKYSDMGMESILFNTGVIRKDVAADALGLIPTGAAPGFAADFFVELGWFAIFAIFGVGYVFGMLWRYALVFGGVWTVIYGATFALSLYFVSQSFGAFLFRFLEVTVVTYVAWQYFYQQHFGPQLRSPRRSAVRHA